MLSYIGSCNGSLEEWVANHQDDETDQVDANSIACKSNHIIPTIHIFNLIELQYFVTIAEWGQWVIKRQTLKLGDHECMARVCVEGDVVSPLQAFWKVRWKNHESNEKHKESKQSSDTGHSNHEISRSDVRHHLCQCFRSAQGQEHVEKVPSAIVQFQHEDNNDRCQTSQDSGGWNGGKSLSDLVGNRVGVSIQEQMNVEGWWMVKMTRRPTAPRA